MLLHCLPGWLNINPKSSANVRFESFLLLHEGKTPNERGLGMLECTRIDAFQGEHMNLSFEC